jgi:VCBS repeat-containing protein
MTFLDFDGATLPVNKLGKQYPDQYAGSGAATITQDASDAIAGKSVRFDITTGAFDPEWNSHNADDSTRGFTREYVSQPDQWQFNTYNRMSFWIQAPTNATSLSTNGGHNYELGTYVKRVANADPHSDETGGGHWYHFLNIAPTGTWTKVVINAHPDHFRGGNGDKEWPDQTHPTGESQYNYFDAMTRFYIEQPYYTPPSYPETFRMDSFQFYQETAQENDDQVRSIAVTISPRDNRVILTWDRNKDQNSIKQEVRYAFSDIHELGWDNATPAPDGILAPPGQNGYNGMVYDTTKLPLAGNGNRTLYLAIKPQGSSVFSQIDLPLSVFWPVGTTETDGATTVTEGGANDTYSMAILSQPTSNVVVTLDPGSQVTLNASVLTFTPDNWNVPQTITVTAVDDSVRDGHHTGTIVHRLSSADAKFEGLTGSLTVQVIDNDMAINSAPVAADDAYTIAEDSPLAVPVERGLLSNDTDADRDTLAAELAQGPSHGTLTLNSDGSFVYAPNADYNGEDTFAYTTRDPLLGSNTATVRLTIGVVNDIPVQTAGDLVELRVFTGSGVTSLELQGIAYAPGGGPDEAGQTLGYRVTEMPPESLGRIVMADGVTTVAAGSSYSLAEIEGMQFAAALGGSAGYGTFTFEVTDNGTTNGQADPRTLVQSIPVTVLLGYGPFSIWDTSAVPGVTEASEASPMELGLKFQTDVNGFISGVRFYKGEANTGTHLGRVWTSSGTLLATATFTNETASGWQQVEFDLPVAVTAGVTYVVSYYTEAGHPAVDTNFFVAAGVHSAPLQALADGSDGVNGVYRYGPGFPVHSYRSDNYWVDAVFWAGLPDGQPPAVSEFTISEDTGISAADRITKDATPALTFRFSEPVLGASTDVVVTAPNSLVVAPSSIHGWGTDTLTVAFDTPLPMDGQYTVTVRGTGTLHDYTGNPLNGGADEVFPFTLDTAGPKVEQVLLGGSLWSSEFLASLGGIGYAIPGGPDQLKPLPWTNLDTIRIRFSEPVNVDLDDLKLTGVTTADYAPAIGFAWDDATRTATWLLSGKLPDDKLLLNLNGSTFLAIADLAGNPLDGEWSNPTGDAQSSSSAYPSGDGVPGGDFRFRFNVLPCDINQNGYVQASDGLLDRGSLGKSPGQVGYSPFKDVNGNGYIQANDGLSVRGRLATSLPGGEPAPAVFANASANTIAAMTLAVVADPLVGSVGATSPAAAVPGLVPAGETGPLAPMPSPGLASAANDKVLDMMANWLGQSAALGPALNPAAESWRIPFPLGWEGESSPDSKRLPLTPPEILPDTSADDPAHRRTLLPADGRRERSCTLDYAATQHRERRHEAHEIAAPAYRRARMVDAIFKFLARGLNMPPPLNILQAR